MKITKFVHSCLLVETPEHVGIFDPGRFSWESGLFNVAQLKRLDEIIITHEHEDHMFVPFIEALCRKFPEATIITTPAAAVKLAEAGIKNIQTQGNGQAVLFATAHESINPLGQTPEHIGVHYADKLTHPGDSHHFTETKEILALPVTAPWGGMMAAAALGAALKPRYIIPIHDWHWNEQARAGAYARLQAFFKEQDITFIAIKDGEAVEIA